MVIPNERHLRRVLASYLRYYHQSRTHLGIQKDTPAHRPLAKSTTGSIVATPEVEGLHHRYERRAAQAPTISHRGGVSDPAPVSRRGLSNTFLRRPVIRRP